jgi:hypothetical protein
MKKILLTLSVLGFLATGCQKQSVQSTDIQSTESSVITERKCGSVEVLYRQLTEDPTLASRMANIENVIQRNIQTGKLVNGVITIPVVVNVIYNTTSQNISLSQIQSQIAVLNEDFNAKNSDTSKIPTLFKSLKGNVGISFVLDSVRRKSSTKTSWTTNDAVKKTAQGGLDPLSPTTKLNIWVCNLSNGILGYAQFPGGSSATDGVVILYSAFGSKLKSSGTYTTTYDLGRTATHEVGHWLNLRHIWGDATCGSDLVGDTPLHNTANYGCPASGHKSTCTGTPVEMTMNYMDYTDDACMYMFSLGQKSRVLATFATGGPRNSFAQP